MARRGNSSQSFLRSKDLLSFSEISHDKDGNNISKYKVLEGALARDAKGQLVRNKANIANILNRYGVLYRMVFNAMNMEQYTYDEVQEALDYLSEYINDLGVSGIVEFHAADKTQNSDHVHFWISSEDGLVYHKIAKEMVAMGYSNKEDVYIQKYEDNEKIDESDYVNDEDASINERFSIKPMGMEAGDRLDSINKVLSIKKEDVSLQKIVEEKEESTQTKSPSGILSSLREKYNALVSSITKLFEKDVIIEKNLIKDKVIENNNVEKNIFWDNFSSEAREDFEEHLDSFNKKSSIVENCTLPRDSETSSILSRIEELRRKI